MRQNLGELKPPLVYGYVYECVLDLVEMLGTWNILIITLLIKCFRQGYFKPDKIIPIQYPISIAVAGNLNP